MSYSVSALGPTKDEAIVTLGKQLDEVLVSQPYHVADIDKARCAVESLAEALPDPTSDEQVSISVSGSLSWTGDLEKPRFTSVNLNVYVSLVALIPAP